MRGSASTAGSYPTIVDAAGARWIVTSGKDGVVTVVALFAMLGAIVIVTEIGGESGSIFTTKGDVDAMPNIGLFRYVDGNDRSVLMIMMLVHWNFDTKDIDKFKG